MIFLQTGFQIPVRSFKLDLYNNNCNMKLRNLNLALLYVSLICPTLLQARDISVNQTNGNSITSSTTDIRKITFSNGYVFMDRSSNSESYLLSEISSITFNNTISSVQSVVKSNEINAYIASNTLYINNISKDNQIASVYNLNGSCVMKVETLQGNNTFETSQLGRGIYILKIENKVVKIIK